MVDSLRPDVRHDDAGMDATMSAVVVVLLCRLRISVPSSRRATLDFSACRGQAGTRGHLRESNFGGAMYAQTSKFLQMSVIL
jgi:hypothetical protein